MARYKHIDTSPRFLAVDLQRQLLPGSFEHALNHLLLLRGLAPHGRVVVDNHGLEHQKDGGNDRINEYVRVRRRSLQTESHPFLRIPRHSATHSGHIRPLIPRPFGRVSRSRSIQLAMTVLKFFP